MSKSGVLISIIYRVVYWLSLLALLVGGIAQGSYNNDAEVNVVVALAVVAADLLIMFIIKQYKKQTKDM